MQETPDPTRRRILEAAGPIFADKGFRSANVREICQIAGANLAAVNYHFRSKEQLYIETVRHAYESCAANFPLPTWEAGVPAARRLRDFVHMMLSRLLSPDVPDWHRLLIMREVSQPTAACVGFVENTVKPSHAALLDILRDLLPNDATPLQRELAGQSIIGQCLHYHHARHIVPQLLGPKQQAALDLDTLTDHITTFSLAALKRLPTPRAERARS